VYVAAETHREKLVEEFGAVLTEAEGMLKAAAAETGEKARDLRSQVESKLLSAKLRLQELEDKPSSVRRPRHRQPTTTCTTIRGK